MRKSMIKVKQTVKDATDHLLLDVVEEDTEEGENNGGPLPTHRRLRAKMKRALDHVASLFLIVLLVMCDISLLVISLIMPIDSPSQVTISQISLVIIALFTVEVFIRITVFGFAFFKDVFMVIDMLIVVTSLICEIVVPKSLAGFLTILRITRIARIVLQFQRHGSKLRTLFKSKLANQSSLEYCVSTLKAVQTSGLLQSTQIKELENVIDILGSGRLYDVQLEMAEADKGDTELKDFINQNFNDKPKRISTRFSHQNPGGSSEPNKVNLRASMDERQSNDQQQRGQGSDSKREDTSKLHESLMLVAISNSTEPKVTQLLRNSGDWSFDIFELDQECGGNALLTLSCHLFEKVGLLADFKIDTRKLQNFLYEIQMGYRQKNPYHNALHGADVLHATYWLVSEGGMLAKKHSLSSLDILSFFVAALIHDFEHPGVNNAFCVKTNVPIAIRYNDKAVLENHHVSAAFKILRKDSCNILSHLTEEAYRQVRENVIAMVMATDMTVHFHHLNGFKANLATKGGEYKCETKEDKTRLLEMVLHFADVSNGSRTNNLAIRWTDLVCEEFFRQGDLERFKELPISPMFDREEANIPKSQRGFLQYVVIPFFEQFLAKVIDSDGQTELHKNLTDNLQYWEKIPGHEWELPKTVGVVATPMDQEPPEVTIDTLRILGVKPLASNMITATS